MSRILFAVAAAALLVGAAPYQNSPRALVQSLYAWSRHHDFTTDTVGLRPYFTPTFYNDLVKLLRVGRCTRTAEIDADIFSGTQVGTYGFRVGTAVVNGGSATVPVTVSAGLTRDRAQNVAVKVIAVRADGMWRVADIMTQAPHGYQGWLHQMQFNVRGLSGWSKRWTPAQRRCIAGTP
ncbi:MAG: hypothetical protein ACREMP_10830 [Candidatus Tyrphobacter sp.]